MTGPSLDVVVQAGDAALLLNGISFYILRDESQPIRAGNTFFNGNDSVECLVKEKLFC